MCTMPGVIKAYLIRYGHYYIPSVVCRKIQELRVGGTDLFQGLQSLGGAASGCRVVTPQLTEPLGTGKGEPELNADKLNMFAEAGDDAFALAFDVTEKTTSKNSAFLLVAELPRLFWNPN